MECSNPYPAGSRSACVSHATFVMWGMCMRLPACRRGFGNLHQVPSETVLQQHSVTSATSQHRQEAEIEQPGVGPSEAFAAFIQLVQQASQAQSVRLHAHPLPGQ